MAPKFSRKEVNALGFKHGLAFKEKLEGNTQAATLHFNDFVDRHGGRLPNGLIPDAIKALPAYAIERNALDAAVSIERAFNGVFCPMFRTELRAHRKAARDARLIAAAEAAAATA